MDVRGEALARDIAAEMLQRKIQAEVERRQAAGLQVPSDLIDGGERRYATRTSAPEPSPPKPASGAGDDDDGDHSDSVKADEDEDGGDKSEATSPDHPDRLHTKQHREVKPARHRRDPDAPKPDPVNPLIAKRSKPPHPSSDYVRRGLNGGAQDDVHRSIGGTLEPWTVQGSAAPSGAESKKRSLLDVLGVGDKYRSVKADALRNVGASNEEVEAAKQAHRSKGPVATADGDGVVEAKDAQAIGELESTLAQANQASEVIIARVAKLAAEGKISQVCWV